jgi:hypothetical protein
LIPGAAINPKDPYGLSPSGLGGVHVTLIEQQTSDPLEACQFSFGIVSKSHSRHLLNEALLFTYKIALAVHSKSITDVAARALQCLLAVRTPSRFAHTIIALGSGGSPGGAIRFSHGTALQATWRGSGTHTPLFVQRLVLKGDGMTPNSGHTKLT